MFENFQNVFTKAACIACLLVNFSYICSLNHFKNYKYAYPIFIFFIAFSVSNKWM